MTAMLRDRLTKVFKESLLESHKSSKEMIDCNVLSFEDFNNGAEPGEFSKEELTDINNLINKGDNANTNDFADEEDGSCVLKACLEDPMECMDDVESIMRQLVNISVDDDEDEHKEHHEELKREMFGESSFADMVFKILKESDYAAQLDFVPDTRLNTADVVNALKGKIGDGSEGVHVDLEYDNEGNKIYQVSQIEKDKLPDELDVVNVKLKLGDHGYTVEKVREDFPVKKD